MIYRYFYPKSGGGWWRRYWQYRLQIVALEWRASDGKPLSPLTLFDWQRPVDQADAVATSLDGWRVSDDRVIGGFSTSTASLLRTPSCWQQHVDSKPNNVDANSSTDCTKNGDETLLPLPFLRWYGYLDTTVGLTSKAQRSGFTALRSPEFSFDGANLRGLYNSLEIVCRDSSLSSPAEEGEQPSAINDITDKKRVYTVNLRVSSSIPEDIYQGQIIPDTMDSDESQTNFQTFLLSFDEFNLTARGRDREFHRQLDDNVKIESIGFVLMDGMNGPFQFDLVRVRAVNRLDDGSVYESPSHVLSSETML